MEPTVTRRSEISNATEVDRLLALSEDGLLTELGESLVEADVYGLPEAIETASLKANRKGNLCYFFGEDARFYTKTGGVNGVSQQERVANHLFVEWVDYKKKERMPIDHGVELGQLQPFIKDPRFYVRYPIHALVTGPDEDQVFAQLAAKRASVRSIMARVSR